MSDVIEVMANAAGQYTFDEGRYHGTKEDELKAALRAAEKAGWRLVPMEPTKEMVHAARHMAFDGLEFTLPAVIQAAPRPWDEVER